MEKELEKFKDYDKKNLFADYYASDECKNPDRKSTRLNSSHT